jgi:hypothetical protein
MPAVVTWEDNLTSDVSGFALVTTLNFQNANLNTDPDLNPMIRPVTGNTYSWEKALRITCTGRGTNPAGTTLSSLRLNLDVVSPFVGGDVQQDYKFEATYVMPQGAADGSWDMVEEGQLSTTIENWTGADPNWNITGIPPTAQWPNSEFLYCQLAIGPGDGGQLLPWNTIAIYNEI